MLCQRWEPDGNVTPRSCTPSSRQDTRAAQVSGWLAPKAASNKLSALFPSAAALIKSEGAVFPSVSLQRVFARRARAAVLLSPDISAAAAAWPNMAMALSTRPLTSCGVPLPPPPPQDLAAPTRETQRSRNSAAANNRWGLSFGAAPSTQCCNTASNSPAQKSSRRSKTSAASRKWLADASSMMWTAKRGPCPCPQPSGSRSPPKVFVTRTTLKSAPKGKSTSSTPLPRRDICFGKHGLRASG
mmetsp:Transcript_67525/g.188417  ORF Transcript_67525/g.188417 Transcript_67525/m.188417 type:complete len:243 (-) Transcript_67525:967-1695(-)